MENINSKTISDRSLIFVDHKSSNKKTTENEGASNKNKNPVKNQTLKNSSTMYKTMYSIKSKDIQRQQNQQTINRVINDYESSKKNKDIIPIKAVSKALNTINSRRSSLGDINKLKF